MEPTSPPSSTRQTVSMEVPVEMAQEVRDWIARNDGRLAYAPAQPARPWTSVPMTVVLMTFAALVTIAQFVILPRFKDVFADFKVELPEWTKLLLWAAYGPGWMLFWVTAVVWPIVATAIVNASSPQRKVLTRRLIWMLSYLVIGAVVAFVTVGLLWPYVALLDAISGVTGSPHN